jgi:hypothetical protein
MVLKNRDRCTLKKVDVRLTEDAGGNICILGTDLYAKLSFLIELSEEALPIN